jgi:hypothetical protein
MVTPSLKLVSMGSSHIVSIFHIPGPYMSLTRTLQEFEGRDWVSTDPPGSRVRMAIQA